MNGNPLKRIRIYKKEQISITIVINSWKCCFCWTIIVFLNKQKKDKNFGKNGSSKFSFHFLTWIF